MYCAMLASPAEALALRTTFLNRLGAAAHGVAAPLGQNDMWTGARASTRPTPAPAVEAEAIEAARLRASGHAHLHHTIAHVARATCVSDRSLQTANSSPLLRACHRQLETAAQWSVQGVAALISSNCDAQAPR